MSWLKRRIIRTYYTLIAPFRVAYWYTFRPRYKGVKIVVQKENEVLCIRNSYGPGWWTFPGGGVDRDESHEEAAKRELREEVGIVADKLHYIGNYTSDFRYKISDVQVYWTRISDDAFTIDPQEVTEARWCLISTPPQPESPRLRAILDMLKNTPEV